MAERGNKSRESRRRDRTYRKGRGDGFGYRHLSWGRVELVSSPPARAMGNLDSVKLVA